MHPLLPQLKKYLAQSWLKRETTHFNSSSAALTIYGHAYLSGLMESRTHLLDVTSEHACLAIAVSHQDPHVKEVVSLIDGEFTLNPLIVKVLADHARRTGTPLAYRVLDKEGRELFYCADTLQSFYSPPLAILSKIESWSRQPNFAHLDPQQPLTTQLRALAEKGMNTHFSADTLTSYGSAVLAEDTLYFGGVYSSFDHRMNIHSEMVAALCAFAQGKRKITHVAIISNKFVDDVPHLCGCCRQFFSEVQEKTGVPIKIVTFSLDTKKTFEIMLDQYFPAQWHSGASIRRTPAQTPP